MPHFHYHAKNIQGEMVKGHLEAFRKNQVVHLLNEKKLFPLKIVESEDLNTEKELKHLTLSEQVYFARELGDLLSSGVNLVEGLHLLSKESNRKRVADLSRLLKSKVEEGDSFSEATKSYQDSFHPLLSSLVASGEASGKLDETLIKLSIDLARQEDFRKKVMESMFYPLFLLSLGGLAVGVLVLWVIPRLKPMFEDMGVELPLITQVFMGISSFLTTYGWIFLFVFITSTFVIVYSFKKKKSFQEKAQYFLLFIPLLKDFILAQTLSNLFHIIQSLLKGGVPLNDALAMANKSCYLIPLNNALEEIIDNVTHGETLSHALSSMKIFPQRVSTLVRIGEESGKLEDSMVKLADTYLDQFQEYSGWLTRLLGPILLLLTGLIIGTIVLSMLLPILTINVQY